MVVERNSISVIKQLCTLMDATLFIQDKVDVACIEHLVGFCLAWSCGACLVEEDQAAFNQLLVKATRQINSFDFFAHFYDIESKRFVLWQDIKLPYQPPKDGRFTSIFVPTIDSTRYSWLLETMLASKDPKPVMFCGVQSAAKSATASTAL